MCKLDLPETTEYFATRQDRGKLQYQSICKKCQKEYRREHYLNNKEKYIDKSRKYREKFINWFVEYKKTLKCEICGENKFWRLDFHHKDPNEKDMDISVLVRHCNKQKLIDEIGKCIVVCSNCHRDIHYYEKNADIV